MSEIAGAMSNEERHSQMSLAIGKFPMMKRKTAFGNQKVSIVCYGPSLEMTWPSIRGPIITVSGAHDYLIARGVTPTWHVECDPRAHKAKMLQHPSKSTKYLMASVCSPVFWDILKDHKVQLWHLVNGNDMETVSWVSRNHPKGMKMLVGGGSSVGQRAMNVAAALGYRRFDVYGMDCSYSENRHAGVHTGRPQVETFVKAGDKIFKTTKQMVQAAREIEQFLLTQDAEVSFHGVGLIQEMSRIIRSGK